MAALTPPQDNDGIVELTDLIERGPYAPDDRITQPDAGSEAPGSAAPDVSFPGKSRMTPSVTMRSPPKIPCGPQRIRETALLPLRRKNPERAAVPPVQGKRKRPQRPQTPQDRLRHRKKRQIPPLLQKHPGRLSGNSRARQHSSLSLPSSRACSPA